VKVEKTIIRFLKNNDLMKNVINLVILFLFLGTAANSQESGYKFTIRKEVPSTPVKNQSATSTCWSFSGISFFESELLRMGKKPIDLSEMYVVREAYKKKAEAYAEREGTCSFSGGGQYPDFIKVTRDAGLVPENVYPGLNYGEKNHNHDEMDAVLKGYMSGVLKSTKHTPAWISGLNGILEAYLGKMPDGFEYDGKYYTPKTFAKELGINFDDYIIISSFKEKPFYKESILKVPDNWAPCTYFNLPVEEMMQVIDNSLMNGYSIAWASDMRGKGFSMRKGVALVPKKNLADISDREYNEIFDSPHPQKEITQDLREKEFEDFEINGDHGMHIIGLAEDQLGNVFYKVKNSWGESGKYSGYIFVSRQYVMLKTTNCMINKNALPGPIAEKLGIPNNQWHNANIAEEKKGDVIRKPLPSPESASVVLTH
jgi:bleomycin hydrolase